jgi:hypothetical protein
VRARRPAPPQAILAALLVAAVVLMAVELGKGAAREPGPKVADPCRQRETHGGGGLDATIQRVVLEGLDGAACRLHTTREELVLSFGGASGRPRRWNRHTIEVALRAGLLRAANEAARRGDVPEFAMPFLRRLIETAPLDRLVHGGIRLGDLFSSVPG